MNSGLGQRDTPLLSDLSQLATVACLSRFVVLSFWCFCLVSFRGRRAPFCVFFFFFPYGFRQVVQLCSLLCVVGSSLSVVFVILLLVPCGTLVQFLRWSLPLGI